MQENITINGENILEKYGASMTDSSLEQLLTPPQVKQYISNSSRLNHGERLVIPAGSVRYEQKELTIVFVISGDTQEQYLQRYEAFLELLTSGIVAVHVPILARTFRLAYLSCSKYGCYGLNRAKLTIKFSEPDPTDRDV